MKQKNNPKKILDGLGLHPKKILDCLGHRIKKMNGHQENILPIGQLLKILQQSVVCFLQHVISNQLWYSICIIIIIQIIVIKRPKDFVIYLHWCDRQSASETCSYGNCRSLSCCYTHRWYENI